MTEQEPITASQSPRRFLRAKYVVPGVALSLLAGLGAAKHLDSDEPIIPTLEPSHDMLAEAVSQLRESGDILCPTDADFSFQLSEDPGTEVCLDTTQSRTPDGSIEVVFDLSLTPDFEATHIISLPRTLDGLSPEACEELQSRMQGFGEAVLRETDAISPHEILYVSTIAEPDTVSVCDSYTPPSTIGGPS